MHSSWISKRSVTFLTSARTLSADAWRSADFIRQCWQTAVCGRENSLHASPRNCIIFFALLHETALLWVSLSITGLLPRLDVARAAALEVADIPALPFLGSPPSHGLPRNPIHPD